MPHLNLFDQMRNAQRELQNEEEEKKRQEDRKNAFLEARRNRPLPGNNQERAQRQEEEDRRNTGSYNIINMINNMNQDKENEEILPELLGKKVRSRTNSPQEDKKEIPIQQQNPYELQDPDEISQISKASKKSRRNNLEVSQYWQTQEGKRSTRNQNPDYHNSTEYENPYKSTNATEFPQIQRNKKETFINKMYQKGKSVYQYTKEAIIYELKKEARSFLGRQIISGAMLAGGIAYNIYMGRLNQQRLDN